MTLREQAVLTVNLEGGMMSGTARPPHAPNDPKEIRNTDDDNKELRTDRREWLARASRDASARAMMPWKPQSVEIDKAWAHAHAVRNRVLARRLQYETQPQPKPRPPPNSPSTRRARSFGPNTPRSVAGLREHIVRNLRSAMHSAGDGVREVRSAAHLARAGHTPPVPTLQIGPRGQRTRYLQLEAEAAMHHKRVIKLRPKLPRGPLNILESSDITLDTRFDIIANCVSPEFSSSPADKGLNRAVWRLLSGHRDSTANFSQFGDESKNSRNIFTAVARQTHEVTAQLKAAATETIPGPVLHDQNSFISQNCGASPTYGDVLWTKLSPSSIASLPENSSLRYIVHALGPDYSPDPANPLACKLWTPYRLKSGLCRAEAKAVLFTAYYRALWQATTIAGPKCSIGLPLLGLGEDSFPLGQTHSGGRNNCMADDARAACCLAHAVYRATGGNATVSVVLPCTGGENGASVLAKERKAWQLLTNDELIPFTCGPEGKLSDMNKAFTDDAYMRLLQLVAETLAPQQCEQEHGEIQTKPRGAGNNSAAAPVVRSPTTTNSETPAMAISMGELLLRRVPPAHTRAELTALLQDKASLWRLTKEGSREKELCDQARQYLKLMSERDETSTHPEAAEEELELVQDLQEGGKWSALFHSLKAVHKERPCQFTYPTSPFGQQPQSSATWLAAQTRKEQREMVRTMMLFLTSEEFLHFSPPRNMFRIIY